MQSGRVSKVTATGTEVKEKQKKLLCSERSALETWRVNGSYKYTAEIFGNVFLLSLFSTSPPPPNIWNFLMHEIAVQTFQE